MFSVFVVIFLLFLLWGPFKRMNIIASDPGASADPDILREAFDLFVTIDLRCQLDVRPVAAGQLTGNISTESYRKSHS